MTFTEAYELIPGSGWLSRNEAKLIWGCLAPGKTILEVGCYKGRSTALFALSGVRVICVDPYSDGFSTEQTGDEILAEWTENTRRYPNVSMNRVRVEEWTPVPVDIAYLDGDHTYEGTKAQIEKALKCNPSVILIHDVNDTGGGTEVKRAAVERLGRWSKRVERLAVWQVETLRGKHHE